MAYLTKEALDKLGFASVGGNVYISEKVSIYNASKISIGSFVRIDDYCILSAGEDGIEIGNYIHISCYACLIGQAKITLKDYVAISIKVTILSVTSDFSGEYLPAFKDNDLYQGFSAIISKPVIFETHSGIGAHSIVMPGVTIGMGTAVGAMSVVYEDLNPWGIYAGNPVRFLKKRSDEAYNKLQEFRNKNNDTT